jgi:glucans biosynthesis protein
MVLQRREFLAGASAALMGFAVPVAARAASPDTGFTFRSVIDLARDAAAKPYAAPTSELPTALDQMGYDEYRGIRFRKAKSLWAGLGLGFRVEFFHRGGLDKTRVDFYEVHDGQAQPIVYSADNFSFDETPKAAFPADLGYAGFRFHALGVPGMDEVAAFLGASYFRAVAANLGYGLSARGLALGTGDNNEEFPTFRSFWLERPKKGDKSVRAHAWLDSPSVSGAYSFLITPGAQTVFNVECHLFPRKELKDAGIAPLTSMYLFGPADRGFFDDFRDAVHDSDGLRMTTGAGEAVWWPLTNPPQLQVVPFNDQDPRGFGLMQRDTLLSSYDDYEAHYENRVSALVKPTGGWGQGAVTLYELPSDREGYDNIVAFWRPGAPLQPNQGHDFRYDIIWGSPQIDMKPDAPGRQSLGRVVETRTGAAGDARGRLFIVDYHLPAVSLSAVTPVLTASAGAPGKVTLQKLDAAPGKPGTVRASFYFNPGDARSADFKLVLRQNGAAPNATPLAETWMYRWTA